MKIVQDMKVEVELLKKIQSEIKLEIKTLESQLLPGKHLD